MSNRSPISRLIVGLLFLVFAFLQWNDSNAVAWAIMYVVTGLLTLATARLAVPLVVLAAASVACLGGAGWVATHTIINPGCMIGTDIPGPALCGAWLGWLAFGAWRRTRLTPAS